ncbi:hypothetical protein BLS_003383 [Venturia inaequalis]|uniref:Zf-C3HC-domain-containing protein n=1 Tax=Venturia inaequalis TaxID=5025 RepID=A0A8H3UN34_VENIN|nr:hypothetical protein BLS_003383 [Venturia inaequalis]RDI76522.1 hypothetical protein Vi05172_g13484 [Venturia inaequalis]
MPSSSSSYKLENSKRKFYNLLDNISTARTESTATLAPEQLNKRTRVTQSSRPLTAPDSDTRPFSASSDRVVVRAEQTSATPSPNAKQRPKSYAPGYTPGKPRLRHKQSARLALDGAADRELPNYAPWSHHQFLTRLKTFADVRTWTPKPIGIGEVEWAKRGWTIAAKDTVGCKGGCEKRLLIKIVNEKKDTNGAAEADDESSWWMGDVELAMVERYKGLIIEAHDEDCLWRKAGCKDDIYRIQQADPSVWQKELQERYASLLTMESALPEAVEMPQQEHVGQKDPFDIDAFAKVVPTTLLDRPHGKENTEPVEKAEKASPISNAINKIALNLALCGWTGQSPNGVNLAYCTKCFQRVGLWLYRIVPSTTPLSSDLEPMIFNPVDLHREHCPWKNIESQCAKGSLEGLSGWQVLVHLVKGYKKHEYVEREREKEKEMAQERAEDVTSVHEDQSPRKSREELRQEDAVKRGRLQRLKRAFTVSKKSKDKV